MTGTVKWFNEKKGYGFINCDGEENSIFVHYSKINVDGFKTLQDGQKVTFDIETEENGNKQAVNVVPVGE